MPARNVIHTRAQLFNVKQADGETLGEYLKRLVDIERKSEFNRITPEEFITYKFAVTIKDKKARDKFINGPLELRTVLETLELDNYNRKFGDKKQKKVEEGFLQQLFQRRTSCLYKSCTKAKAAGHRQEKIFNPELQFLRET